jgi:multidrug efflux pump subunit AcrA (membrane-fusion protein)
MCQTVNSNKGRRGSGAKTFTGYFVENEIFYLVIFGNNSGCFPSFSPHPIKGVALMRRFSLFALCSVVALSLMMIGCAKEPAQELSAARAAVASAKAAQADKYVAQEFAAVQDSLTAAEAEIAKQKAAAAFSRNYDKAKATLANVMSLAAPLNAKSVEEKAKVQAAADNAIAKLTSSVSEAKELVKKAPKGKAAKALFEAKAKEIAEVESSIAGIQAQKTAGDFAAALDAANAGVAKIESIKAELAAKPAKPAAAPKAKGKKRR